MKILYEDDHILVCEKPAGVSTQAGKIIEKDMVSEVNNYLRKAGAKAPAYLIHRLDKPVRGILLFAKTKAAASTLSGQLSGNGFKKHYYAIVEGHFDNTADEYVVLENYIYKDPKTKKAVICENDSIKPDNACESAKKAILKYRVISQDDDTTTLEIHLVTGRYHQIRCQLANILHPILGDNTYGSEIPYKKRNAIGLIAYSLSFVHPVSKKSMTFTLENPL